MTEQHYWSVKLFGLCIDPFCACGRVWKDGAGVAPHYKRPRATSGIHGVASSVRYGPSQYWIGSPCQVHARWQMCRMAIWRPSALIFWLKYCRLCPLYQFYWRNHKKKRLGLLWEIVANIRSQIDKVVTGWDMAPRSWVLDRRPSLWDRSPSPMLRLSGTRLRYGFPGLARRLLLSPRVMGPVSHYIRVRHCLPRLQRRSLQSYIKLQSAFNFWKPSILAQQMQWNRLKASKNIKDCFGYYFFVYFAAQTFIQLQRKWIYICIS